MPRSSSATTLATCIRAWRRGERLHSGLPARTAEQAGDLAFSRGDFPAAVAAYALIRNPAKRVRAKHGWCQAISGRFAEAAHLLTADTCGDSSAELAVLAAVIVGGWDRPTLRGFKGLRKPEQDTERDMETLVMRALAVERPDYLAFHAYRTLMTWYRDREAALLVADRACSQFPKADGFAQWRASLLRTLDRPNDEALDHLLALEWAESSPYYRQEIFETALAIGRYDDADAVLERLRLAQDEEIGATAGDRIARALMRAYLDLRRAQDADPGAARRAVNALDSISADLDSTGSLDDQRLATAKLRLAVALELRDIDAARRAAIELLRHYWSDHSLGDYGVDMHTLATDGLVHEAEFGKAAHSADLSTGMKPQNAERWRLLVALFDRSCPDGEGSSDAHRTIADLGPTLSPDWALSSVAHALLRVDPARLGDAGRVMARHALERESAGDLMIYVSPDSLEASEWDELVDGAVAALSDPVPGTGGLLLEALREPLFEAKRYGAIKQLADALAKRSDSPNVTFYCALGRHGLGEYRDALAGYRKVLASEPDNRSAWRNLILVHHALSERDAIAAHLPALELHAAKAGTPEWTDVVSLAKELVARSSSPQSAKNNSTERIQGALASFPPLTQGTIDPAELSLLEAASVLALLRACDLDHVRLTLAPLAQSKLPYEPTDRFDDALLALAERGIVRIAEDTPASAFDLKDADVAYYVHRLKWRVSTNTLQLAAAIRDLARSAWPTAWKQQAEPLARDLATEECVAYLEYLCEQRRLVAPERADARALFRELLEHASESQCWYYIYTSVQRANDWQTRYRPSHDKVTAKILRGMRDLGEKARENQWTFGYQRIMALPRSHLAAALHDVLTRWGERAFDEPIRSLVIEQ